MPANRHLLHHWINQASLTIHLDAAEASPLGLPKEYESQGNKKQRLDRDVPLARIDSAALAARLLDATGPDIWLRLVGGEEIAVVGPLEGHHESRKLVAEIRLDGTQSGQQLADLERSLTISLLFTTAAVLVARASRER